MILYNKTRKTTLSNSCTKADSMIKKSIGLLGKDKHKALIITTRFGIHTVGMQFPLDILVLNTEKKVVAMKKNLVPNRFFFWNPFFDCIIELPEGAINSSKTEIGDTLLWTEKNIPNTIGKHDF